MNLLHAPWLPFRLRNGDQEWRPLIAITDPDIVDFALPRADFQGAAYQLVIGILQTAFAPKDKKQWHQYYEQPPTNDELKRAFNTIEHAFELTGDGPLFMQDHDPLSQQELSPISWLPVDAPTDNAIKLNKDFFVKRRLSEVMSLEMAALALFTFQINGPGRGPGYRVGLRGAGPLTTLVMPSDEQSSLWRKLWLNVINCDTWRYDEPNFHDGSVFPWLAPTIESSKKGSEIYPSTEGIHPLQMYWAMPSRIRLVIDDEPAQCLISGENTEYSVRHYRTKNYGNNYVGNWDPHPFTPYKWNPQKPNEDHSSQKGKLSGISYKNWDVLTLSSDGNGHICARVIEHYYTVARRKLPENPKLWVFGYDLDQAKINGWYSTMMPLFDVEPENHDDIINVIKELQDLANNALYQTRSQIKAAWFQYPEERKPKEVKKKKEASKKNKTKGDTSFIDLDFWQQTEATFYLTVSHIAHNLNQQQPALTSEQAKHWRNTIQSVSEQLFDSYALDDLGDIRSMAKRMDARGKLMGWLYGSKNIKAFNNDHNLIVAKDKKHAK
ncbi:type I-E CRISPR-associated protein Cse1/CasA [Photobacterium damselae subsp. damselae]|uniref:type I-E CRISPR-associated protein Cse1/CasA n=1 Tax=Photobacterium damselae TaxID=38293 RepID=UPI000D067A6A|nr:type I-E CRISPR-associated protein Cse1/CasA [Photobacterium damselae]PSB91022.1 type I-E CRISPR-associated protein Cse1/CasA [Photobacterium damselae subsp. damselae]